jgi:hypothetical protein
MLGTEISSIPSPKRPFGAAASRNDPVWVCPQLTSKRYKILLEFAFNTLYLLVSEPRLKIKWYPSIIGALIIWEWASSV